MDSALSVDGVPIRLPPERWFHIAENHDDLAGHYDDVLQAIEDPDLVVSGHGGSLMAVRSSGHNRYLVVIYRQVSRDDGFVITAYFTATVSRKRALWRRR